MSKLYALNPEIASVKANVIFVHGLGNVGEKAFAMDEAVSWKTLLSENLPDVKQWIYEYDASVTNFDVKDKGALPLPDRARTFRDQLELNDEELANVPLIFVGYSMGGLITKQVISDTVSMNDLPWLLDVCIGISFIATPHFGSDVGSMTKWLHNIGILSVAAGDLVRDDTNLGNLDSRFRGYFEKYNPLVEVFVETAKTKGVLVVPESSADPRLQGIRSRPIEKDHLGIPKVSSVSDIVYAFTQRMIKKAIAKGITDSSANVVEAVTGTNSETDTTAPKQENSDTFIFNGPVQGIVGGNNNSGNTFTQKNSSTTTSSKETKATSEEGKKKLSTNDIENYKKSIVAIKHQGENIGCGVYVAHSSPIIFSCAHVVNAALSVAASQQEQPEMPVTLFFPFSDDKTTREAKVIAWQPIDSSFSGDVAVMQLLSEAPADVEAIPLYQAANPWNHPFQVYGYPKDEGEWTSGEIINELEGGYVQLEATKATGYQIRKGYSGGGVWDENVQAVVGIVVAADRDKTARAAFMIPVNKLHAVYALEELQVFDKNNEEYPKPNIKVDPQDKNAVFDEVSDHIEELLESEPQLLAAIGTVVKKHSADVIVNAENIADYLLQYSNENSVVEAINLILLPSLRRVKKGDLKDIEETRDAYFKIAANLVLYDYADYGRDSDILEQDEDSLLFQCQLSSPTGVEIAIARYFNRQVQFELTEASTPKGIGNLEYDKEKHSRPDKTRQVEQILRSFWGRFFPDEPLLEEEKLLERKTKLKKMGNYIYNELQIQGVHHYFTYKGKEIEDFRVLAMEIAKYIPDLVIMGYSEDSGHHDVDKEQKLSLAISSFNRALLATFPV